MGSGVNYELMLLCFERACLISSSVISLKVPVLATPPVIAATPTSFAKPRLLTSCFQYEMSVRQSTTIHDSEA